MENLLVTIVQPNIEWESISANLEHYEKLLAGLKHTSLIVFPEMFTTGFSMNPEKLKETMDGRTVSWMKKLAFEKKASVLGSVIIEEDGKIYNRAIWVFPDGKFQVYDKRHLFSMGNEKTHYSGGVEKTVVTYNGWRICPLICYDLRFPAWSRNSENYDVLIYMANWPSPRHHAWKNLLIARAIENQAYCTGVNRVGTDGMGLSYLGDSAVVSPKGFAEFLGEGEEVHTFQLSFKELHDFRKLFPVLNDRDEFELR